MKSLKPTVVYLLISCITPLFACSGFSLSTSRDSTTSCGARSNLILEPAYSEMNDLFQLEVINLGLRELGYTVAEPVEVDYATVHLAIGDCRFHYTANHWDPLHRGFLNTDTMVKIEPPFVIGAATQTYVIDQRTSEERGIESLVQFLDPNIASLFDHNQDGKSELYGCNPGWGCANRINDHIKALGLQNTVSHIQGSYYELIRNEVIPRVASSSESVLFYMWSPSWVNDQLTPNSYPLSIDSDSFLSAQGQTDLPEFSSNTIHIVANKEFLENHPAIREFFNQVKLPIEDVDAHHQILEEDPTANTPAAVQAYVKDTWLLQGDNRDKFYDIWLENASEAAGF